MRASTISSQETSSLCENIAMLLEAGIQMDEALDLLSTDSAHEPYGELVRKLSAAVGGGSTFAQAVAQTQSLPSYAEQMLLAAEETGTLEKVLKQLAAYYDNENKLRARLKSAVVYPAMMLGLMALVLGVLAGRVLPTFMQVYSDLTGDLTVSSYGYLRAAYVIAWVPLCAVAALAVLLCIGLVMTRSEKGRSALNRFAQGFPVTRCAMLRIAQTRMTGMLSVYIASGTDADTAFRKTAAAVDNSLLRAKADACIAAMQAGRSLPQAIYEAQLFDALYARMLQNGARSGNLERALEKLTEVFAQDAELRVQRMINTIEPMLAAFLTVSVGFTLLSAMLPLVGILSAVG
ncbi:MAG: type II secretion system F family protein [Ruthenibacterium sp.]